MNDCYYCKEFDGKIVQVVELFCTPEEQDKWANKHYGKRGGQKSIGEIQARLLKMGKQAPVTTNGQLFEETDEIKINLDH